MTEQQKLSASAELLAKYGYQINPNDEFLLLYFMIKDAQKKQINLWSWVLSFLTGLLIAFLLVVIVLIKKHII